MVRLWVPVGIVLSIGLAGFALPGGPVASPVVASAPDASPAGLVRVVENTDPAETLLVGFELDLHADDWQPSYDAYESELALAPFGELTGWGVFVFDHDGALDRMVVSMPSEGIRYPLATPYHNEASMAPRVIGFYEEERTTFLVVVALVGTGGMALGPNPEWEETPTAEELLALPSATPAAIGVGTGFVVQAHADLTYLGALGGQVTMGAPEVSYGGPLPSHVPTPLLDLSVKTTGPAGWSYVSGGYLGYESQGIWEATIEADGTHDFRGLVLQHWRPPYVLLVELVVLGLPFFGGYGATATQVTAEFNVTSVNADYIESYVLEHVALGAPLTHLIGVEGPAFSAEAYQALLGGVVSDLLEPHYAMQDDALVTRIGDVESVVVGAVPPQVQDGFDRSNA